MGFDFYFPLFKFSQEIRFSRGLVNMLQRTPVRTGCPLNASIPIPFPSILFSNSHDK